MQAGNYGIEEIPDTARLYYRIHKNNIHGHGEAAGIPQGKLPSSVFRFQGGNLSVDWSKYATPEETRIEPRVPEDNGIVDFTASPIRADGYKVEHTPEPNNRAHSSVSGDETAIRLILSKEAKWVPGLGPEIFES